MSERDLTFKAKKKKKRSYLFLIGKCWKHMGEKSRGKPVSVLKHLYTNKGVWEMNRIYRK